MNTTYATPITTPADMERSRTWAGRFIASAAALPISFAVDGQTIHGIPAAWQPVATQRRIDANLVETIFEGRTPQSGLEIRVECTEYLDYPVVEWVAWLTNQGTEPTPILSNIRALDGAFSGAAPVLYHCNGDFYSETGYTPQETPLQTGDTLTFAPNGGRGCDGAFPYYRVTFAEGGFALAIGWPAQWSATFQQVNDGVQIQAGQEKTHLRLLPGETIRTPRITLLSWAGDSARAVNLWRRWYLAHVLPRPNGQPLRPLLACAATDDGEEFTAATTENQIRYMDKFKQRGLDFDVWWIDAGWYPCYNKEHVRKWTVTGTWEPDAERFPTGLKPISDHAAVSGADLLLWFEPERVRPGTQLDVEHADWLLHIPESENGLLNLGNPACREWLTDHVCQLIKDNGIKIYRQDHNFPPLAHWRKNEAEDRQGINENLHVQGYLQFWDDLLARNPGLWLDSCASGGRRNDLETMRRSVPLHYTDYGYGDHPVKLAFHRTLYEWIPYFKECTLSWDGGSKDRFDNQIDSYAYHCGFAPMLFATLDIRRDDYDYAMACKMIEVWRKTADLLLYGDYYPHTAFHKRAEAWVAWQFDCPETGRGLVQGIRLPAAAAETLTIHPQGIQPTGKYWFENPETGETKSLTGEELRRDGFTFALPARSGAIWLYQMLTEM
ncbi:MAG: alpha-galactosidase [Caldilineaceae bacterium]